MPTWTTGGYHPMTHTPGQPAPRPALADASEVTAGRKLLAFRSGASHLSADGETGYCVRYGKAYECSWDGFNFGYWGPVKGDELPEGAVKLSES